MNDVVRAIEESFRSLLCDKRYKSITVKDICERAHVSRQSFYVNFRDKEGVVTLVFKRDVIDPVRRINEIFSQEQSYDMMSAIQSRMYQAIYDDREYYRNLVVSMRGVDDTFIRVVTNTIYDLNREIFTMFDFHQDDLESDYVAYFYASSQAMFVQKWICDNFPFSVERITQIYSKMANGYWHDLYR